MNLRERGNLNSVSQNNGERVVRQNQSLRKWSDTQYSDNFQKIDKIESKGALVEFLNTGFDLKKDTSNGRVRINFQKRDELNRQISFGSFYLSFEEVFELSEFIQHDLVERYVESMEEAKKSGSKYCRAIYVKYAGAVSENGVISRVLELTPGIKEELVITYKEGPGAQNPKTKLITPAGKMDKFICVPLSVNRLISVIDNVKCEIIAYKAAVHVEMRLQEKIDELNSKLDAILKNLNG